MARPKSTVPNTGDNRNRLVIIREPGKPEGPVDIMAARNNAMTIESDQVDSIGLPVEKAPEPVVESPEPKDPVQSEPAPDSEDLDDIPEKFKGKGVKDVAKAYTELEKLMGSRGEEVARMRKFVDELLVANATKSNKPGPVEDTRAVESARADKIARLLSDPDAYEADIERKILDKLTRKETVQVVDKLKEQNLATLQSQEFAQWLVTNIPQEIAQKGDNDPAVLNMILSAYKGSGANVPVQGATEPKEQEVTSKDPREAARQAVTKVRSAQSAAGVPPSSTSPNTPRPMFTRSELMDMRLNRPDEYERRNAEILRAYADKRVKNE